MIVYIEFHKIWHFRIPTTWNDVKMTSSLCFSEFVHETCQRQLTELKLGKLIVPFKVCKFENHVTRNHFIMMSLPKTRKNSGEMRTSAKPNKLYFNRKLLMRAIKNVLFIKFEPLCQKLWAFLSNFGIFFTMPTHRLWSYHVTKEANFKNFYFVLILHLILGKVTKFLMEKLATSVVISQNFTGGFPPGAFSVKRRSASYRTLYLKITDRVRMM